MAPLKGVPAGTGDVSEGTRAGRHGVAKENQPNKNPNIKAILEFYVLATVLVISGLLFCLYLFVVGLRPSNI